jgi:phosphohistidine swiveling domain-containing protein
MVAVAINRTDFTAATLRAAAVCTDDAAVTRRALAIAMILALPGHFVEVS